MASPTPGSLRIVFRCRTCSASLVAPVAHAMIDTAVAGWTFVRSAGREIPVCRSCKHKPLESSVTGTN